MKRIVLKNLELIKYIGLSYFDKAIIFLVPLAILFFFKDDSIYVHLEYIFSLGLVVVPVIAVGLPAFFFIEYRNAKFKRAALVKMVRAFHLWYLFIALLGVFLYSINQFIFQFEEDLFLVVIRVLFVVAFTFFASLFRLTDKPRNALYITLIANVLTLSVIIYVKIFGFKIELWHAFLGQILFVFWYIILVLKKVVIRYKKYLELSAQKVIYESLIFSWPSIIQVFIMLYIGNYGKINAIKQMSVQEGALFALLFRLSMIIQLSHSSIVAFSSKAIYNDGGLKNIDKSLLNRYLLFMLIPVLLSAILSLGYHFYQGDNYSNGLVLYVGGLVLGYTVLWSFYSYFEMFYSREKKNIIKLYLAIANAAIFFTLMNELQWDYIEKVSFSMFISILITFIISVITLRFRGYKLV